MFKPQFILAALLAAFVLSPLSAYAADGAAPSYAMKKQNRVSFKSSEAEDAAAQPMQPVTNPADIEPAAGGFEPEDNDQQENSLADTMKLPRK